MGALDQACLPGMAKTPLIRLPNIFVIGEAVQGCIYQQQREGHGTVLAVSAGKQAKGSWHQI